MLRLLKPVIEISTESVPNIGKLCEIETLLNCFFKPLDLAAKVTRNRLAGGFPNQRDVDCHQEMFKGDVPARLDRRPKAVVGFGAKPIHLHDFLLMPVEVVQIGVGVNPSTIHKLFQCAFG